MALDAAELLIQEVPWLLSVERSQRSPSNLVFTYRLDVGDTAQIALKVVHNKTRLKKFGVRYDLAIPAAAIQIRRERPRGELGPEGKYLGLDGKRPQRLESLSRYMLKNLEKLRWAALINHHKEIMGL